MSLSFPGAVATVYFLHGKAYVDRAGALGDLKCKGLGAPTRVNPHFTTWVEQSMLASPTLLIHDRRALHLQPSIHHCAASAASLAFVTFYDKIRLSVNYPQ